MIQSKVDLKKYIVADLKSLGIYPMPVKMKIHAFFHPEIWKFQKKLRTTEYLKNCRQKNLIQKIIYKAFYLDFVKYGYKLGFTIPLNVCGPGLCICHVGTIIINERAKLGSNVRIHAGVNIGNASKLGDNWSGDNVPIIGDNVYLGPGAKLFGKIVIGDNVAVGANAVVNKDVPDNVTVAGVPAHIINHEGSQGMIVYGWKE